MTGVFEQGESERRTENLILMGVIASVDLGAARARVSIDDDWTTDALPWLELRAGRLRVWSPPTPGEQVIVLSPSGVVESGVILRGLPSSAFPALSDREALTLLEWDDGASDAYDADTKIRRLSLPAGGVLEFVIEGGATLRLEETKATVLVGGSEILVEDGKATIRAADVALGEGALKAVARHDDPVVNGKVVASSTKVKAA